MAASGMTRFRLVAIALLAFGSSDPSGRAEPLANREEGPRTGSSRRMADGKQWTVENLNLDTAPFYCYEDSALNCSRYGRLYTWESAQRGCLSLGSGWRLPTEEDWRELARRYGGVSEDA